jgi:hypothetical protein
MRADTENDYSTTGVSKSRKVSRNQIIGGKSRFEFNEGTFALLYVLPDVIC